MIELTKTLDPDKDYPQLKYAMPPIDRESAAMGQQHPHRRWEYAMALTAIGAMPKPEHSNLCLDIGGAGSPLSRIVAHSAELDTVVVDPLVNVPIENYYERAPFVLCISVLEHVPDLYDFCRHLVRVTDVGSMLFLTVDLWNRSPSIPDTAHFAGMRTRIFTPESWKELAEWFYKYGFLLHGEADWEYHGDHVYNYSFASLSLRRT